LLEAIVKGSRGTLVSTDASSINETSSTLIADRGVGASITELIVATSVGADSSSVHITSLAGGTGASTRASNTESIAI